MTDSTDTIFDALRQAVQTNTKLQARLFNLGERQDFITAVRELAQSLGYMLEESEVQQAMLAGWQAWTSRRRP